jgi:hypothetical protein
MKTELCVECDQEMELSYGTYDCMNEDCTEHPDYGHQTDGIWDRVDNLINEMKGK